MRTWRNWQTRKIQVLMVARLCRFKSCCPHQKRQSERVVFFHAAADLKQNYVLSANGTAFVCPCTLCSWRNALQVNLLAYAITLAPLATSPVVRTKANKNEPKLFGSFFHILVCDRTCDNAGHCLHTPCAPARCAADASLTRINSPVSLLRSFYSLQVLFL